MKVTFDPSVKLAGIGLVPWTRLGLEKWIKNYKIASYYDWDITGNNLVLSLEKSGLDLPKLPKFRTQDLLETKEFQKLLINKLDGYKFITYKPVEVPKALSENGFEFAANNLKLTSSLENKAIFRHLFRKELTFPSFKILELDDLFDTSLVFDDLSAEFGSPLVVQDAELGGGRGTKLVRTRSELVAAVQDFVALGGGQRVVVSEYIRKALERSMQCCVTRYGVFCGPLQKQIVAHPLLANLEAREGDKFCGGEVLFTQASSSTMELEAQKIAHIIGEKLQQQGYRGIFGIDFLIDKNDSRLLPIEINPRVTGMTPMLTMMYRQGDIPFYLLHILELLNIDYQIDKQKSDENIENRVCGMLILHSNSNTPCKIIEAPSSGEYDFETNTKLNSGYQLSFSSGKNNYLIQRYTPVDFPVKPGGRLMTVYFNQPILDDRDALLQPIEDIVNMLYNKTKLSSIV